MASTVSSWLAPRLSTFTQIGISTLTWPLVLGTVYVLFPAPMALDAPVDRFLFTVQWCSAPAVVLLVLIMNCMRIIDTEKAEDPFAGAESRRFLVNQRVVQNTIEQMSYFLPALLALSIRLDPSHTRMIPALVITWCLGRFAFWIGYRMDPHYRSLGFGWTQNTAVLTVVWFLVTLA